MKPGLEEESEELKEPESLSVEQPWETERWLRPETLKVLTLQRKDWPELKLTPGQVNMLWPRRSSNLEHVKKLEPTIKDEQKPEVGIWMELWPN